MYRFLKKIGNTDHISEWKSKGLSNESINPTTSDKNLAQTLGYFGNKTRVKFDGSCLKQDKITFTHEKTVNIYIVYEINLWNYVDSSDPETLILINTSIPDMVLDLIQKKFFSFPTGGSGKNVIIFGVDMSSSVHIDNKKKDILILGESPTQGLDDATLTAEKSIQLILLSLERNCV